MTPVLDIYWADNDTLHDDMVVRLGSEFYLCDSYWLAVQCTEGRDTQAGARQMLRAMVNRAAREFSSLVGDWTRFFPFGFFDQGMQWLRVERFADRVELSVGWSEDGAHTFHPASGEFPSSVTNWRSVSPAATVVSLTELCELLNRLGT